MERVVLNALAKQTRLGRLILDRAALRGQHSKELAPLAIGLGIVFGEADPPFAKRVVKSPATQPFHIYEIAFMPACKFASKGLGLYLAITVVLCPSVVAFAQDITPTPQTIGEPVATTFEVIVTGSNIPTAEEVGPQPVDTYRKVDIERLGVRSATDFVQKLPVANGASFNENLNTIGSLPIMIAELCNKELITDFLVNNPMLGSDPP